MSSSSSSTAVVVPFDWSTVITDTNEIDAIRELRLKLTSIENDAERTAAEALSDGDLMRFVRARELNVDKSMQLLVESIKWRLEVRPTELSTDTDAELAGCEKLQTLWLSEQLDVMGRPVIYMKPGGANPHSVPKRVLFLVMQLEHAVARMTPPVTQFTWICDFSGYGQRARSPGGMQVARESLHVLQTNYCERLGAMFIINAPFFFSMVYTCMSPFMSARTKAKIQWISGDAESLRAQLKHVVATPDEKLFEK